VLQQAYMQEPGTQVFVPLTQAEASVPGLQMDDMTQLPGLQSFWN